MDTACSCFNGERMALDAIPCLPMDTLRARVLQAMQHGARVSQWFGLGLPDNKVRVFAVLAEPGQGQLSVLSGLADQSYRALTPECPQFQGFERELAEQWGVVPEGHPWLKPIRFQSGCAPGRTVWHDTAGQPPQIGVADFFSMGGDEIHEVAVGPVHAGIIEPGHFRFQCHGEIVFHLEIVLGYQHRGVERALRNGPDRRSIHLAETLAGDTTVGHALAYCQCVEALSGVNPPPRAQALRGVALELERLANHTGDLGALSGDVGFLPTASYCGRIRGDFLNMTALLCGNRFGRSLVRPGGVTLDLEVTRADDLRCRLAAALKDVTSAVELLWTTPSVLARFEDTGALTPDVATTLGLVGPAARACGLEQDVRYEFPAGIYCYAQIPPATWHGGDVFARAYVRWIEIQRSLAFIREQLDNLPEGPILESPRPLAASQAVVALVEGWRGEISHMAITDDNGRFAAYKITDPSFHNWRGLALAMRNQQISDFPLCNKSFNLSYCGHDL